MIDKREISALKDYLETNEESELKIARSFLEDVILELKKIQQYRSIGTVEELQKSVNVRNKVTEIVNMQLITGNNNYKEIHDCFHEIVKVVQDNY